MLKFINYLDVSMQPLIIGGFIMFIMIIAVVVAIVISVVLITKNVNKKNQQSVQPSDRQDANE